MTSERLDLIGIHIEGIPGDDETKSGGRVYYFDNGQTPDSSTVYEWVKGMVSIPESVDTTINPFTGEWSISSFTFALSNNDDIATYIGPTGYEGSTALAASMTESGTTMVATGSALSVGDVRFVEDETIRVDGIIAAGIYTVARGVYGSTEQTHESGEVLLERPPYWVPRVVELVTHDPVSGDELVRWRGLLDSIETSETGARLLLRCSEALSRWKQARVNQEPLDLNAIPGSLTQHTNRPRVAGSVPADDVVTANSSGYVAVQIGQAIFAQQYSASSNRVYFQAFAGDNERLGTTLKLPSLGSGKASGTFDEPVWVPLVWDRIGDEANPGKEISPLSGATAFHPMRIARELISNTSTGIPDEFSLRASNIDLAAFDQAVTDTPDLQIDKLALGINGESFSPWEEAEKLIRFAGYIPSITDEGDYSARRFEFLTVANAQAANDTGGISPYQDGPLHRRESFAAGATEITAVVGELLSVKGHRATVLATGGSRRARLVRQRERVDYDIPFLGPEKGSDVAVQLANSAALIFFDMPRLRIRAPDSKRLGLSYDLGAYIPLEDLGELETDWWVTSDFERISSEDISGRLDVIGLIVGRRLHLGNMTYTLELLFVAFAKRRYIRERAPSAVTDSWDTDTLTVDDTFTDDDASYFESGDEVELWSRDGVKRSTSVAIVDEVNPPEILLTGSLGVTPKAGEILRIANSADYFNDARYSITGRPYVHFADSSEEIDHDGEVEDADLYGGGLGVNY